MGMTIDKAIPKLQFVRNALNDDTEIAKAYDLAISTMRKYQKIEGIVKHWVDVDLKESPSIADTNTIEEILEVIEDGNDKGKSNRFVR